MDTKTKHNTIEGLLSWVEEYHTHPDRYTQEEFVEDFKRWDCKSLSLWFEEVKEELTDQAYESGYDDGCRDYDDGYGDS